MKPNQLPSNPCAPLLLADSIDWSTYTLARHHVMLKTYHTPTPSECVVDQQQEFQSAVLTTKTVCLTILLMPRLSFACSHEYTKRFKGAWQARDNVSHYPDFHYPDFRYLFYTVMVPIIYGNIQFRSIFKLSTIIVEPFFLEY